MQEKGKLSLREEELGAKVGFGGVRVDDVTAGEDDSNAKENF